MFACRLFGGRKQCAKCCEILQPDELVMRGREHLYHTRCFSCHVCQTHLVKGSTFGMVGTLIFCQQHYQMQSTQPQHDGYDSFPQHHHQDGYLVGQQEHQEPYGSPQHHQFEHLHHYGVPAMVQQPQASHNIEALETSGSKLYVSPSQQSSPSTSLKSQRVRANKKRPSNSKTDVTSIVSGKLPKTRQKLATEPCLSPDGDGFQLVFVKCLPQSEKTTRT